MILSITKMILIYLNYRLWSIKLKDIYGGVLDTLVLDRNLDVFDMYRLFLFLWMFELIFKMWDDLMRVRRGTLLSEIPRFTISVPNSNTKRCYYDPWLHLSIPTVVLSLSFQTSTIGNDDDTIFSSSFWFDIGTASYFETFKRFFALFECNENENSVKARDQRNIFLFWRVRNVRLCEDLVPSSFYIHTFIFHQ